jgi:hypothetical protein
MFTMLEGLLGGKGGVISSLHWPLLSGAQNGKQIKITQRDAFLERTDQPNMK